MARITKKITSRITVLLSHSRSFLLDNRYGSHASKSLKCRYVILYIHAVYCGSLCSAVLFLHRKVFNNGTGHAENRTMCTNNQPILVVRISIKSISFHSVM